MKEIFSGFYKKSDEEIKNLWDKGIICFDANVLLNLYRYSNDTREALLELITKFKKQIWLPHQSALEYNRNRYEVIADQEKAYKDFISKIGQIENDLQSTSKPPFLSDKLHSSLKKVFKEVNNEVEGSIEKYCDFLKKDSIYESLTSIFKDKISGEYSDENLQEIYTEGKIRFEKKIPPGFEDEKTKQGNRKFGDLVLWKQIIDKAKKEKKPIILITDERKIDWWWKIKDGRNMGPRQELIEEIKLAANVDFHMYSSERFLSYGLDHLKEKVNKKALEEIKEIKRAEIEELESLKKQELIRYLKKKESYKFRDKTQFLEHKIQSIKEQINRLKHRQIILEDEPFQKDNNQEEYIHLSIDLKKLEENLERLYKDRERFSESENSKFLNIFRKYNLEDENEKN